MNIEAFILIGGRSVRFGEDKAFARFGQRPFAEHAAATAAEAFPEAKITFVTSSEEQFDSRLLFSLGHRIVADLEPGSGAWSGFHTAINYEGVELVLLLACDLPLVSADLFRLLLENVSDGVDAVVPRQPDGRLQPLAAIYHAAAVRKALAGFEFGRAALPSLTSFVEGLRVRILEATEYAALRGSARFFANINTTDDLAAAVREE